MTANRLAAIGATVAVLGAVIAGIFVAGSPAEQRLLRIDERRVDHLRELAGDVRAYWHQEHRLPPDLASLTDGIRVRKIPTDPQTGEQYDYLVRGDRAYRLCAEFRLESEHESRDDFWFHPAGRVCFDFDVEPE